MLRSQLWWKRATLPLGLPGAVLGEAKVLIVEDESYYPIVSFEIEDILREAGFEWSDAWDRFEKALGRLKNRDYAVLDANLRGGGVAPVATRCRRAGVHPCLCAGYERVYLREPSLRRRFCPRRSNRAN
jgi:hypothetical protein